MRIYALGGLGADIRVYANINLSRHHIHPVNWITPKVGESLTAYAKRLSVQIDTTKPFAIMGVSFGGMMAMELTKYVAPFRVILISSVAASCQLPAYFKWGKWVPEWMITRPPIALMNKLFGTQHPLLKTIIADSDLAFLRWAVPRIAQWEFSDASIPVTRIHGTRDSVIPLKGEVDFVIKDGGHFMVVDQGQEIQQYIHAIDW